MYDHMNESVGLYYQTLLIMIYSYKCQLNHFQECICSLNTLLSYSRPWFVMPGTMLSFSTIVNVGWATEMMYFSQKVLPHLG